MAPTQLFETGADKVSAMHEKLHTLTSRLARLNATSELDRPMRSIYSRFLAPIFESAHCPIYGVGQVHSWMDTDGTRWWQVTVVLGRLDWAGLNVQGRDYLFRAFSDEQPEFVTLGMAYDWPQDQPAKH